MAKAAADQCKRILIGLNEMLLGGDILLEVAGIQVSEGCYQKTRNRLSHMKTEDIITVKVLRAGRILQLSSPRADEQWM